MNVKYLLKQFIIRLFYNFTFEINYDVLQSQSSGFLLTKKQTNKNKSESKMENLRHVL